MTYHYPKLFFDNKARYGTQTFSSQATGYPAANLKDLRSHTYWKPTTLSAAIAMDVADPVHKWEFTNTVDGWNGDGMTLTPDATYLILSPWLTNSHFNQMFSAPIRGDVYRYVIIRYKWAVQGSGWDGKLQWATRGHAGIDQSSYYQQMANPGGTGWVTVAFDMWNPTAGGRDWRDNLITYINFDFVNGASVDEINVDWVCLSRDPFCDHFMLWGHDCATQGNSIKVEGSDESSSTSMVTLVPEFYPANDDPIIKTISSNRWTRWKRITFSNGSAPTIAMMHVGQSLEVPGFLNGIDPIDRMAVLTHNRSAGGYPLGVAVDHEEWEQDLDFRFVDTSNGKTWVRDTWLPVWKDHIRGNPFVLQWNPTDYPNELIMLTNTDGKSRTPHGDLNYAGLQMSVRGRWHK